MDCVCCQLPDPGLPFVRCNHLICYNCLDLFESFTHLFPNCPICDPFNPPHVPETLTYQPLNNWLRQVRTMNPNTLNVNSIIDRIIFGGLIIHPATRYQAGLTFRWLMN